MCIYLFSPICAHRLQQYPRSIRRVTSKIETSKTNSNKYATDLKRNTYETINNEREGSEIGGEKWEKADIGWGNGVDRGRSLFGTK